MFFCSGTAEVKREDVVNDDPKTNLTDGKDELFCGPPKCDTTEDPTQTENTQDDIASQPSVDCGSVGALDESDPADSRINAAQTQYSNGYKSKRPSSPGPHPVKTTCFETYSSNPKHTLVLSISPRKDASTSNNVEMLSPDSPIGKAILFNSSADKEDEGSVCAEESDFAVAKVESQQFVNNSDSGSLAKERLHVVAMGSQDAEIAECSGLSDVSHDLIGIQSGVIFERYL